MLNRRDWVIRAHQRRTVVKAVIYRVFMIVITVAFAFFVTGHIQDALTIGLWSNAVKTITYYGYDRVWNRIAWGLRYKNE